MCLVLKYQDQKKARVAEKDIYCLKAVELYRPDDGRCMSFYVGATQYVGLLMKETMCVENHREFIGDSITDQRVVTRGLHAVRLGNLLNYDGRFTCYLTVMLAKIPKGSKYYEGEDGDIVSNRMILIEPLVSNTNAENLEVDLSDSYKNFYLSAKEAFDLANEILREEGYEFPNN